ncbi:MAG: hypothetical protein GY880_11075 [Planctomycetaceae bacterium]|nr:hypothetical protein [Planctomycetaceae bacterium]
MSDEPVVTAAAVVHHVVRDLLCQQKFEFHHLPEFVDLAAVGVGLGVPLSQVNLVNEKGLFWDTTEWETFPRPFLDQQDLAYAFALSAWVRGETASSWLDAVPAVIKKPAQKSLKYLSKQNDSFFCPQEGKAEKLQQDQNAWLETVAQNSISGQIIGLRYLQVTSDSDTRQLSALLDKLRSDNPAVLLNAINTAGAMKKANGAVVDELNLLLENRNDKIRAKAMFALARLAAVDEGVIKFAIKMLESHSKFVIYAGLLGLSSVSDVPSSVYPAANRAFIRSLQICDYEFIGLFVSAFQQWVDDPELYLKNLLQEDSPEYFEIAMEALTSARERLVELGAE